jgi:ABC-2 type transport system ATP-binding protein
LNTPSQAAISVSRLRKDYPSKPPVHAVRGIDLEVARGECFGLLGPNGAGKTTTVEILEGLLAPTSGDIRVLGLRWEHDAVELRARIGISLQETKLADKLTVMETLRLFRSFYPKGSTAQEMLDHVGLSEKSDTYVMNLSGGQRQRLAVATALIGAPEILFLDEPTTGLDPTSRRQLWDLILRFRDEGGTVLLTTHGMDEAERLCDRVAIVDQGKIIAQDSPASLIRSLGGDQWIELSLSSSPDATLTKAIGALTGVERLDTLERGVTLMTRSLHETLPRVVETLNRCEAPLTGLRTREATLEDVFIKLTGRRLAEDTP